MLKLCNSVSVFHSPFHTGALCFFYEVSPTRTRARARARSLASTRTHTHTRAHTHSHTFTHTHTHATGLVQARGLQDCTADQGYYNRGGEDRGITQQDHPCRRCVSCCTHTYTSLQEVLVIHTHTYTHTSSLLLSCALSHSCSVSLSLSLSHSRTGTHTHVHTRKLFLSHKHTNTHSLSFSLSLTYTFSQTISSRHDFGRRVRARTQEIERGSVHSSILSLSEEDCTLQF